MFYRGEIPFVRLLVPLISGILLGLNWPWSAFHYWLLTAGVLCCVIFFLLIRFYASSGIYRKNWLPGIFSHAAVLCAGAILTLTSAGKYNSDFFANSPSDALIVIVATEPLISGKTLRFEATVKVTITSGQSRPASGKLLISVRDPAANIHNIVYGSRLLIRSNYREVDPPYNPGEFDFRAYLEGKQIYHQAFVERKHLIVLSQGNNSRIVAFALRLRQQLVSKFYRYITDDDAAALASTLILGYRASLNKDIISAYAKTGTLHVLSVSGMHVGIVFIVLNFLLSPLRRTRGLKYPIAFAVVVAIWWYALITGFSPSVCRAAAMLSFIVFGKALNKNLNNYNLLAISAFVLLIYNPYFLVDVGFQLSYLAVFGLIYFQPKIYHLISVKNKAGDYLWKYTALSLAAQLATFPISLYYFHQFPVYFLLSNLLVVLPVALIMYLGLLFLFLPWPQILDLTGDLLNQLILITNKSLFLIESLPFSTISGVWLSTPEYTLIYLIITSIFLAKLLKSKQAFYAGLSALILLATSIAVHKVLQSRQKERVFYSLRQQSAIAFIAGRRSYLVTDVPDSSGTFSFSIKPGFDSKGVSQIVTLSPDSTYVEGNNKILVSPNILQFENYRVLRWNERMDGLLFSGRINADAILLSGNPRITIKQLRQYASFSILLIDASNAGYRIKQWQAEADKRKIPFHILKGAPAYIVRN